MDVLVTFRYLTGPGVVPLWDVLTDSAARREDISNLECWMLGDVPVITRFAGNNR